MKKLIAISAAAAIIAMAGTAMAATANLSLSATVISACVVTPGTLAFGNLDPTTSPVVNATSAGVTVTCTKGDGYSMTLNLGQNPVAGVANLKGSGTDVIPYTLTVPPLTAGTGTAQTVAITGAIAANSYKTVAAASFSDTVVITVTP